MSLQSEIERLIESGDDFSHVALKGEEVPSTVSELHINTFEQSVGLHVDNHYAASFPEATTYNQYAEGLDRVISRLGKEGGKTVISRVMTIENPGITIELIARGIVDLFRSTTDTCRFVFFRKGLGLWVGSTPELLLRADLRSGTFSTMALAGTRPYSETVNDDDWDDKNRQEHALVIDDIVSRLNNIGIKPYVKPTKSLRLGEIVHLMTPIEGMIESITPDTIIRAIHPTAAISGYPREKALADIAMVERHRRDCYGGFLSVLRGDIFEAYVILRCLRIEPGRIAAYAGGGILADSAIDTEFKETETKMASTLKYFVSDHALT